MKISFYGVKNATCVHGTNGYQHTTINGIIPEKQYNTLHMVVTNENNRDLDNIEQILKIFPNRIKPNTLDITLDETYNGSYFDTDRVYGINEDTVNLNRLTLPLFEKIQKFLEKVGKMDPEENIINKNFATSKEAFYAFRRHYEKGCENDFKDLLKDVSKTPESGTDAAEYFSRLLKIDIENFKLKHKQMDEYTKKYF